MICILLNLNKSSSISW